MPPPSFAPEVPQYGQAALDKIKLLPGGTHFICEAHLLKTSAVQKDYHHKIPQEADGSHSAENIAILCSGCHQLIHRLAVQLSSMKSKSKQSPFEIAMGYANDINRAKASEVAANILSMAQLVAQYRVMKADNQIAPPDGGITVADMPNEIKVVFKQIARDIKRGDGRSIGMANLAALAITEITVKHRPEMREIADNYIHSHLIMSTGKPPSRPVQQDDDFDEVLL